MIGMPICKEEGRDISLCGGQAYDRNAYMQGRRTRHFSLRRASI